MGRKFRSGAAPDQCMLMPADPREWLPAGHLAWKVLDLAGEMDLSGFAASYRGDRQGGRPYDPEMMATLLLYCYCRGRRSAREIEMATFDDVGARVICGGLHPDHSTVAEFVRRHLEAACALLPESVKAGAREGLVSLELVAGDGTKLKANASMASNVTAAQLDAQIAELEDLIGAEFRQWAQDMLDGEDTAPAPAPPGGDGEAKGKKKPKRAEQTLARRKAARAQLQSRQEGVCQISCVRAFSGVFLVRTMCPACQVLSDPVLSYMPARSSWLLINRITVLLRSVGYSRRVTVFP